MLFDKNLRLALLFLNEAEPQAHTSLAQDLPREPEIVSKRKREETYNYPDWVTEIKSADAAKAWRERPSWMRGMKVRHPEYHTKRSVTTKKRKNPDTDKLETVPDYLTRKSIMTLSGITFPLEHGWTEGEVLKAMMPRIIDIAVQYARYRQKFQRTYSFEDAVQAAALGVLDALRTDKGISPFTKHAFDHARKYVKRYREHAKEVEKKEPASLDKPIAGAESEIGKLGDLFAGTSQDFEALADKEYVAKLIDTAYYGLKKLPTKENLTDDEWFVASNLKDYDLGTKVISSETHGAPAFTNYRKKISDIADKLSSQKGRKVMAPEVDEIIKSIRRKVRREAVKGELLTDQEYDVIMRMYGKGYDSGQVAWKEAGSPQNVDYRRGTAYRRRIVRPMTRTEIAKELGVSLKRVDDIIKSSREKFEIARKKIEPPPQKEGKVSESFLDSLNDVQLLTEWINGLQSRAHLCA
jgi:RNA polymerase sigma factor (sigma-70 family)